MPRPELQRETRRHLALHMIAGAPVAAIGLAVGALETGLGGGTLLGFARAMAAGGLLAELARRMLARGTSNAAVATVVVGLALGIWTAILFAIAPLWSRWAMVNQVGAPLPSGIKSVRMYVSAGLDSTYFGRFECDEGTAIALAVLLHLQPVSDAQITWLTSLGGPAWWRPDCGAETRAWITDLSRDCSPTRTVYLTWNRSTKRSFIVFFKI